MVDKVRSVQIVAHGLKFTHYIDVEARMFVRWKKRKLKEERFDYSLSAYLVESYRDVDRNPRQRNIAYLGSVKIKEGRVPAAAWLVWRNFYVSMDEVDANPTVEANLASKIGERLGVFMNRGQVMETVQMASRI